MQRRAVFSLTAFLALALAPLAATAQGCATPETALGVERVIEIDTATGPLFGDLSVLAREDTFLAPKEVVLTFDDGPMPWITKSILDTLDRFCTKATFFSVGRMAIAYPASVKDVLARGHTLGGHTWSHPMSLKRLGLQRATDEIERGFAAVALAAGQPIAPFFRFPGLSDSDPLMAHLQTRGIGAFTVDVVSNDSFISNAARLASYTLDQLEKRQGGIMLFHDIKAATAKALPEILEGLRKRGYKVVHLRSKAPLQPHGTYEAELAPMLAKARPAKAAAANGPASGNEPQPHLVPFFGEPGVLKTLSGADVTVAALAPPARERAATTRRDHQSSLSETGQRAQKSRRVKAGTAGWRTKPKRAKAAAVQPVDVFGF